MPVPVRIILAGAFLATIGMLASCSKSNPDAAQASATTVAAPVSPAPSGNYAINLTPPWKEGQKFGFIGSEDSTDSDGGKTSTHLEADAAVLSLLPDGDPKTVEYTVRSLQIINPDVSTAEVPAAGAKILTQFAFDDNLLINANGHPVSDDLHDALEEILTITGAKHPDQEVLGPTTPVTISASWPINSAAYLDNEGKVSSTNKATGNMTFIGVQGTGSGQTGTVSGMVNSETNDPGDASGQGRDTILAKVGITDTFPLSGHGVFAQKYTEAQSVQPLHPNGQPDGAVQNSTDELMQQVTIP